MSKSFVINFASIKKSLLSALTQGCTPQQLAASCSIGIYIAFSPFFGAHALMMLAFNYLFRLHLPTLFIATSLNNPWTMIPFYSSGYAFGYWLVHSGFALHPTWQLSLGKIFGSKTICVWSFLVGGNVLGIIIGCASYPLLRYIFAQLAKTLDHQHFFDKPL